MQSPSALSPAEEQLLAFIREGRFDAEIAVRLGVGPGDVKERIERLRLKLGAADRQGLRAGIFGDAAGESINSAEMRKPDDGRVPGRTRLLGPATVAVLVLAGICVFAVQRSSASGRGDASVSSWETPSTFATPFATPSFDMALYLQLLGDSHLRFAPTTLNRNGDADLGKMFDTYPSGTLQIQSASRSDGSAVLTFSSDGSILFTASSVTWTLAQANSATATLDCVISGVETSLVVKAQGSSRLLPTGAGLIGVYTVDSQLPRITIMATGTASGEVYPVSVDTRGHLLVSSTPLP